MRIDRRVGRALRRYGPGGLAREAWARLRGLVIRREDHVWYELERDAEGLHIPLRRAFARARR